MKWVQNISLTVLRFAHVILKHISWLILPPGRATSHCLLGRSKVEISEICKAWIFEVTLFLSSFDCVNFRVKCLHAKTTPSIYVDSREELPRCLSGEHVIDPRPLLRRIPWVQAWYTYRSSLKCPGTGHLADLLSKSCPLKVRIDLWFTEPRISAKLRPKKVCSFQSVNMPFGDLSLWPRPGLFGPQLAYSVGALAW